MADVWANSVACHPRATCHTAGCAATWRIQCHDSRATCHVAGCCHRANSVTCHPRATYHIAGCCHLVNSLSRFQSHMPHATLQDAVTWRNQCHDRATLQGVRIPSATLKIVFCHILFFWFLMQFRLWRAAAFVSSPMHLFSEHSLSCVAWNFHLNWLTFLEAMTMF